MNVESNLINNICFEKATFAHKEAIFAWLEKPHVQEFWDNSQAHHDDILNFMGGRKTLSAYFDGCATYWVGSINNELYCFLLTSEMVATSDLSEVWRANLSSTGKTFTIDFAIGNEKYLGRGLGALTLEAFTKFIHEKIDPAVDTFLIDPSETNPRAKHVYEKVGFMVMAEYVMDKGFFKGIKHFLMKKKLL